MSRRRRSRETRLPCSGAGKGYAYGATCLATRLVPQLFIWPKAGELRPEMVMAAMYTTRLLEWLVKVVDAVALVVPAGWLHHR